MDAPLIGTALHAIGAMSAASCYTPQKSVKNWSWQTYWISQAFICWLIAPSVGAMLTIPELGSVLREAPTSAMWITFALGLAYGIGGTAFGLAIRFIGFSLTYAFAIGISCILGTLVGPVLRGQLVELFSCKGSEWVITGLVIGVLGIVLCGIAGRLKELDLAGKDKDKGEFSILKGVPLCILAGILSAVYGIAVNDTAMPIIEVAAKHGAGHWQTNVGYIFANSGAFITTSIYCLILMIRHKTFREFVPSEAVPAKTTIRNYLLALATGLMWYGQFLFYGLGHVRMGNFKFVSWAIHMIMLILFSSLIGVIFKEWKSCKPRTAWLIAISMIILVGAVLTISTGSYMGTQASAH
jgi:L-rhamnose-H+ transport protein